MQHIEIHIINDETDAEQAEDVGLTEFALSENCANCQEAIAYTPDGFYPCAIVLTMYENEDVEYLLCDACVSPIVNPGFIS